MAVDRLGSGRYRARVKLKGQVIATSTFDREREARDWHDMMRTRYTSTGYNPRAGRSLTLEAAFDQWMVWREPRVAPATLATDRSLIRSLPQSLMRLPISSINKPLLEDTLYLVAAKPSTLRRLRSTISALYTWAQDQNFVAHNPAAGITIRGTSDPLLDVRTWDDIEGYAEHIASPEYRALVRVLSYTGLRWGEARALRVGDIRGQGLYISRSHSDAQVLEKGTKTGRSRTVPIFPQIVEDVTGLIHGKDRDDYIFTSPLGFQLNAGNFMRDSGFKALSDGLSPHDLRHSAISNWLHIGVPVTTAQVWAGHSSLTTTARYAHALAAFDQSAVDLVGTSGVTRGSR